LHVQAVPADDSDAPQPTAAIPLRVMSFNIEWGGAHVSFENVVEVVRRSQANVVGIQEAEGNLERLAAALGWNYNLRQYVISRFPLAEPPGVDGKYVLVEVAPGRMVALANVHLPSDPYGPDAVRDGASPGDVLALERTARLPFIQPVLAALQPLIEQNVPVFLTGDFNAPAFTDWTEKTVGTRPFMRYPLEWPVSRAVVAAGLHDSWREQQPDPVTHPGLTWWAGRPPLPSYAPGANDPQDRIDFVWFAGAATLVSSQIAGERGAADVSISVAPWPSDHRAVVSEFSVVPAVMPRFANTGQRVYTQGEDVVVVHHGALEAEGLPARGDLLRIARLVPGQPAGEVTSVRVSGNAQLTYAAALFPAGHYLLSMGDSTAGLSPQNEFWVLPTGAEPSVSVTAGTFKTAEPITVDWSNAPGNRNDYLAIYAADESSANGHDNEDFLAWVYTNALPEGQVVCDGQNLQGQWPLPPGKYVVKLMKDDSYEQLAESGRFSVE
jgi:endonuclease/exonuclease/phosphatase family metal-dependent hydrolase